MEVSPNRGMRLLAKPRKGKVPDVPVSGREYYAWNNANVRNAVILQVGKKAQVEAV